ncbi:MAG: hypothetical protein KAY82_01620 [Hylemonella sp.]|nr:hypothetical protein [Hylemonella sp.]
MPKKILILDTSILCCWLRVPGKDTAGNAQNRWDHNRIDQLLVAERARGSLFVLPIASLIETGNHIAQCTGDRFNLATLLTNHLQSTVDALSPWAAFTDQSALWESPNLQELAATWPQLAVGGTSIGDATIKHVAEHYSKAGYEVEILTGDEGLKAYETLRPSQVPRRRS